MSTYVDTIPGMAPGFKIAFHEGYHYFEVTALATTAIHTGRRLYCVLCLSCAEVVHDATTGPISQIERHIRELARQI